MHPLLFQFGPLKLPAYGALVACGYLAAIYYIFRRAPGSGLRKEALSDLVFYSVLGGMAGAKLFYAATYWQTFGPGFAGKLSYLASTFQYGFVFYGGLLGGAAAFLLVARRSGVPPLQAADIFAPALALGHAFGRIGCFLAGCCHGAPTSCLLGVTFSDPASEVNPALLGVPVHPSQLYEAFGNFLIFLVLDRALVNKRGAGGQGTGRVTCLYAALYALQRFLLEFLRGDDRGSYLLGLSPAQLISAAVFAAGAAGFLALRRNYEKNRA